MMTILHRYSILGMVLCMATCGVHAQNVNSKRQNRAELDEFRRQTRREFNDFRQQCLKEYANFLRNPWQSHEESKPVTLPEEKPLPPTVMPDKKRKEPAEDKAVTIEEVISPINVEPQPKPIAPIKAAKDAEGAPVEFTFYGTKAEVRFNDACRFKLNGVSENAVANVFATLNSDALDVTLADCLKLRESRKLSDWAYLNMLRELANSVAGSGTNEAVLLLACLYMQSGYKMRLASDGRRLYMLYASKHDICNHVFYSIDGDSYYGIEKLPAQLFVCKASFPREKSLSLLVTTNQLFDESLSEVREISSELYKDMKVSVAVNKNLLAFYESYPASIIDKNIMTQWSVYANTPLDVNVKKQIYPYLKEYIKGDSQLDAVNKLLNFVQTGFKYEYDTTVWGRERNFFAEESLYYPYCDCEDRSILFTRLVRDLLGLDCILIHYPRHLAAAVAFTEGEVNGDQILLKGKKFTIADATYINAPVGYTMPDMDNRSAKVILLEK